jgi:hypothetical protein
MTVSQPDGVDERAEWRADDDNPRTAVRTLVWGIVLFALPGIVIVAAGGSGPGAGWTWSVAAGFLLIGGLIGIFGWSRDRRSIVAMRLEPAAGSFADSVQFTVRRLDDSTTTYPAAAVDRVRVTRDQSSPPSVQLRMRIGGANHRTRSGPADTAEPFLGIFAENGAAITTRTVLPD